MGKARGSRSDYVSAPGLDELADGLLATAKGLTLISSYPTQYEQAQKDIARRAHQYVWRKAPGAYHSAKDGRRGQPPIGAIQDSISSGVGTTGGKWAGAWVSAGNKNTPHLYVTEFGGSVWWRSGKSAKWARGGKRKTSRTVGHFTVGNYKAKSHMIEGKGARARDVWPRVRRGRYIWNTAYRLRSYIGLRLAEGIADTAKANGIRMSVAPHGGLHGDLHGQEPPRRR